MYILLRGKSHSISKKRKSHSISARSLPLKRSTRIFFLFNLQFIVLRSLANNSAIIIFFRPIIDLRTGLMSLKDRPIMHLFHNHRRAKYLEPCCNLSMCLRYNIVRNALCTFVCLPTRI